MDNPSDKDCWVTCGSCYRCYDKGRYPDRCNGCSGRHDPEGRREADPDDYCDCRNGILRLRTKAGKLIVTKFKGNPFAGKVIKETNTKDEQEWQAWLNDTREALDDEHWDPIRFQDGTSTDEWMKQFSKGQW